jgi:hypothetical protein
VGWGALRRKQALRIDLAGGNGKGGVQDSEEVFVPCFTFSQPRSLRPWLGPLEGLGVAVPLGVLEALAFLEFVEGSVHALLVSHRPGCGQEALRVELCLGPITTGEGPSNHGTLAAEILGGT